MYNPSSEPLIDSPLQIRERRTTRPAGIHHADFPFIAADVSFCPLTFDDLKYAVPVDVGQQSPTLHLPPEKQSEHFLSLQTLSIAVGPSSMSTKKNMLLVVSVGLHVFTGRLKKTLSSVLSPTDGLAQVGEPEATKLVVIAPDASDINDRNNTKMPVFNIIFAWTGGICRALKEADLLDDCRGYEVSLRPSLFIKLKVIHDSGRRGL